jgi:hypothetical protein
MSCVDVPVAGMPHTEPTQYLDCGHHSNPFVTCLLFLLCILLLLLLLLLQGGSLPPGVQASPVPGQYGQRPAPTHEYHQTQTIKNQVNLKKKTLRLEPLQDSSSNSSSSTEFALRFAFDASAPCRVTTFLLATEDPRQGCKIVAAAPGVRQAAYYPKGVSFSCLLSTAACTLAKQQGKQLQACNMLRRDLWALCHA